MQLGFERQTWLVSRMQMPTQRRGPQSLEILEALTSKALDELMALDFKMLLGMSAQAGR